MVNIMHIGTYVNGLLAQLLPHFTYYGSGISGTYRQFLMSTQIITTFLGWHFLKKTINHILCVNMNYLQPVEMFL